MPVQRKQFCYLCAFQDREEKCTGGAEYLETDFSTTFLTHFSGKPMNRAIMVQC